MNDVQALAKIAAEKQATMGAVTGLGALIGALGSGDGQALRGAGHGAVTGAGTELGMLAGGGLGAGAGMALGGLATLPIGGIGAIPGALAGGLAGTGLGGYAGFKGSNAIQRSLMDGPLPYDKDHPSKQKKEKEEKEEEKEARSYEKLAKGRCWDGYEPVPGKKAYSDGSCQPAGGKKKKKKSEKAAGSYSFLGVPLGDLEGPTDKIVPGAALGAIGGAGLGGLTGAVRRYLSEEEDESKKPSILNSALVGGLAGGGLGGAAGYFGSDQINEAGRSILSPSFQKEKPASDAALQVVEKVAAYRRVKAAAARIHRVKLAHAVIRRAALLAELNKYDPVQLSKSAAVGARKSERMKAAALVRQAELEKQAVIKCVAALVR